MHGQGTRARPGAVLLLRMGSQLVHCECVGSPRACNRLRASPARVGAAADGTLLYHPLISRWSACFDQEQPSRRLSSPPAPPSLQPGTGKDAGAAGLFVLLCRACVCVSRCGLAAADCCLLLTASH